MATIGFSMVKVLRAEKERTTVKNTSKDAGQLLILLLALGFVAVTVRFPDAKLFQTILKRAEGEAE